MKSDRRKTTDRRRGIISWPKDRRVRPDRRLNNISAEWIPFNEIYSHPSTRDAFCSINRKNKAVQVCERDLRDKEPIKKARREMKRSPMKSWKINIFKRTQRINVEQRTIPDRRTKNIKLPYNRRVRPDRRLNNIALEWIPFE